MGFRTGAYATVWGTPESISKTMSKVRITITRKNKETGEYEADFSGYVRFCGTAAVNKAANLRERDRIKLGDVDVTNKYDKEKQKEYTDFKIWSFEDADADSGSGSQSNSKPPVKPAMDNPLFNNAGADGENPEDGGDERLPF